ncbi:hypothetical protein AB0H71_24380 [Nocardia sp. NPDC050697]|uniref:hypothetical protein n=1 Tax=Nocardia sp. NPDC050697 TaxID=3155158 RepID=UPI0034049CAC
MTKTLNSLSEEEYVLVRSTKKGRLVELDEDELLRLHTRVRRARNKFVKIYRRSGAAKVEAKGARGAGKAANVRNAAKVEIFEGALSRVSRQLATASKRNARKLKDERLALARADAPSFSDVDTTTGKVDSPGRARVDTTRRSPGRKKFEASSIAAGTRRQAKKDQR